MTDGKFCAKYMSQYQEILSKMRLFGIGKYSKLGRALYMYERMSLVPVRPYLSAWFDFFFERL